MSHLISFCAAQDILDNFRDSFIECVDANAVVHELRYKKIISDGDLKMIERHLDTKQQNEILHGRLWRSCDEEALMEVCDMMIAVDGNRRMNALGREMKCELEKGICCACVCVFLHVCVCVPLCAHVCVRVCVCVPVTQGCSSPLSSHGSCKPIDEPLLH